jgi:hypothetical protein
LKFDDAGKWKIVDTHRMTKKGARGGTMRKQIPVLPFPLVALIVPMINVATVPLVDEQA